MRWLVASTCYCGNGTGFSPSSSVSPREYHFNGSLYSFLLYTYYYYWKDKQSKPGNCQNSAPVDVCEHWTVKHFHVVS
jgi:hypothetical protein